MRILLVNPRITYDNPYTAIGFRLPPLNLLYVASILKKAEVEVEVWDEVITPFEQCNIKKYDLIGITSDTPRFNRALAIARACKGAGKKVVIGGIHVTSDDINTIKTGYVDYVIRNEAELILEEFINRLKHGEEPEGVKGVTWIFNKTGEIHVEDPAPLPLNLDSFPLPDRDIINMDDYKVTKIKDRPITSVFTSRGCPYNCDFCITPKLGMRKWRRRDPVKVIDEVELVVNKYGFGAIAFLDDNFGGSKDHVEAICNEIIKRKLDIYWYCQMRTDIIADNEDLVELMKEAGCFWVFLGLESGSNDILRGIRKKNNVDKGKRAIELLKKYKIRSLASFTIGHINETKKDIERTIKYSIELEPTSSQFCVVTPYPGSSIYEQYKNRIVSFNWDYFNSTTAIMYTDQLTPQEIQKLLQKCYIRFFLRPKRILRAMGGSFGKYQLSLSQTVRLLKSISSKPLIDG